MSSSFSSIKHFISKRKFMKKLQKYFLRINIRRYWFTSIIITANILKVLNAGDEKLDRSREASICFRTRAANRQCERRYETSSFFFLTHKAFATLIIFFISLLSVDGFFSLEKKGSPQPCSSSHLLSKWFFDRSDTPACSRRDYRKTSFCSIFLPLLKVFVSNPGPRLERPVSTSVNM